MSDQLDLFRECVKEYVDITNQISEASKNYYMYGANTSSTNMIYDPSATTPARFKQTSNEKYKTIYQSVHSSINELGLNEIYLSNMNDLFEKTQEENIKLKKNIENYLKRTVTDDRKSEYKNKSYVGLMPYTYILLFIYFSLLVYYILFSNFFKDKLYLSDNVGIFIFIYVLFPYLVSLLLSYLI